MAKEGWHPEGDGGGLPVDARRGALRQGALGLSCWPTHPLWVLCIELVVLVVADPWRKCGLLLPASPAGVTVPEACLGGSVASVKRVELCSALGFSATERLLASVARTITV